MCLPGAFMYYDPSQDRGEHSELATLARANALPLVFATELDSGDSTLSVKREGRNQENIHVHGI